jgi:hypothetical protein
MRMAQQNVAQTFHVEIEQIGPRRYGTFTRGMTWIWFSIHGAFRRKSYMNAPIGLSCVLLRLSACNNSGTTELQLL